MAGAPREYGPLTILVVSVVTGVWAFVSIYSIVFVQYQPLLYVQAPMLAVVGYATGIRLSKNGGNG